MLRTSIALHILCQYKISNLGTALWTMDDGPWKSMDHEIHGPAENCPTNPVRLFKLRNFFSFGPWKFQNSFVRRSLPDTSMAFNFWVIRCSLFLFLHLQTVFVAAFWATRAMLAEPHASWICRSIWQQSVTLFNELEKQKLINNNYCLPNLITKITSRSCKTVISFAETSCAHGDTICLRASSPCGGPSASCRRGELAQRSSSSFPRRTRSHGPTRTAASALRVKAALSKAAWWSWSWKWCPSHVWRGLPLCQFWSS